MADWLQWLLTILGLLVLFVVWSWVPLQRVDRYWRLSNPVGRPLAHTLVLTGIPALIARQTGLRWPGLLVPICFFLTQYAALSGRVVQSYFITAGWVMVAATIAVWSLFFLA